MEDEGIGAIKIKDGLFVGDESASQVCSGFQLKDVEFIVGNKVTHAINCAGHEVGNIDDALEVACINFYWTSNDSPVA